jgi:hypothetical protein
MNRLRNTFFTVFYGVLAYCLLSCNSNPQKDTAAHPGNEDDSGYLALILSFDTLPPPLVTDKIDSVLKRFAPVISKEEDPYYHYFKGHYYRMQKKADSALYYHRKSLDLGGGNNLEILNEYSVLYNTLDGMGIAHSDYVTSLLTVISKAEKYNSLFTYRLYDLLAKSYFNNMNLEKAKEYTLLYFQHHPLKKNRVIAQRYHDICFMIARALFDGDGMQKHLDSSRQLAIIIGDSIALMRSYENEAQFQSLTGQYAASVVSNRKYFQYLKEKGELKTFAFNNLATSFARNKEVDSAIYYYKEGILWGEQNDKGANLFNLYAGLRKGYESKGDFRNAYINLDSVLQINHRNSISIQAEKIEEIHTRYETEKKDQAIALLETTNGLNKKIILQQRWIFAAAGLLLLIVVLFIYNTYRRRLLVEKNEKLLVQNQRLILEQKTRQIQLNPHFIYNAIANLQGLISSDKKKEANAYLVSFSKLMRNILELNRHNLVPLADELASVENYIQLQQMRYEYAFDYQIDNLTMDTEAVFIPPMLLQPFVENSIEHGFKNIDYKGLLTIRIQQLGEQLHIVIRDNGAGSQPGLSAPSGKKSLSRIITQERLDLLFNTEKQKAWFASSPLNEQEGKGFLVEIYIPLLTE